MVAKLRKLIENLIWSVLGSKLINPLILNNPQAFVFIYLGNIFRSAYALHYSKMVLSGDGALAGALLKSSGLHVKNSVPLEMAVAAAQCRNVNKKGTLFCRLLQVIEDADMVIAMEPKQVTKRI